MSDIKKKFINNPSECVDESLRGFTLTYPMLYYHEKYRFITKTQLIKSDRVAILSGGGSGHEPFCSGFVGEGMLTGAVAGNVFASPPKSHILQAIYYLQQFYLGGVLVIIPNYTGDCLNFGMAVEAAKNLKIKVASIIVGEDCASAIHENTIAGQRGMCGLLYLFKIAGAMAQLGKSLEVILNELRDILRNLSTLGISSSACSLPGQGPLFEIAQDKVELGTGVHGEAGIQKLDFNSAKDSVKVVLDKLLHFMRLTVSPCPVVVMVNNLGGNTELEQNIICNEVYSQLKKNDIVIKRMYSGSLMTSLDMCGFQISILKLPEPNMNMWLYWLDYATEAPKWVGSKFTVKSEGNIISNTYLTEIFTNANSIFKLNKYQSNLFMMCLREISDKLKENEAKLNELDSGCGDGDCGSTMKCLSEGIDTLLTRGNFNDPADVLKVLSDIAENQMGGTLGALHNLFLSSMNNTFLSSKVAPLSIVWANAWKEGVETIKKYGHAKLGDRTIIDVLEPACLVFCKSIVRTSGNLKKALIESLKEAKLKCEETKNMTPRAGRASYVDKERVGGVEDAGAFAFLICLRAIVRCICE